MKQPAKFVKTAIYGLILGSVALSAQADSYDDGLMAYAAGNYADAGRYLTTAAEQGSAGAEHMLMRLFSEGKLQSADLNRETLKWTRKAAENGIKQAQFELAEIYAKKQGNVKDAIQWYRLAANQNHPDAFFELGEIYNHGAKNVEADTQKSTRMYQIAASEFDVYAQKGNAKYQYTLAKMYQHSKGVRKNIRLAIKWMGKSAQQGHAVAQLELGRLYAKGDDVPRDINQAKHWLTLAAAQGTGSASTSATAILNELNQDGNARLAYAF
ncbi:MAG: sel1 repeat family protein [Gammaproteobacteria bacterium]|nr:sel1 repeat family protein [Gammaproteobacteria bacterium]